MSVFKNMPRKVQIRQKKYKVSYEKNAEKDCIGFWDYHKSLIWVDGAKDRKTIESTLLHEIFHGISDHYQLNFSEKTVLALERGFYEFLLNNRFRITKK